MNQGILLFNEEMIDYLVRNKRYLLRRPAYIQTFAKISFEIKAQTKVRDAYAKEEGLIIPPVLIMSVTNDCNLSCKGCYACNQNRDKSEEMSIEDISRVVDEAIDLGVSVILIAGGEPLMKQGILDIPKKHPGTLFVMFTNGLLLTSDILDILSKVRNLIPIISIEGNEQTTDERRGKGTYCSIIEAMERLDERRNLSGVSVTMTRKNFEEVISKDYLYGLQMAGCRAVFLIEYVPVKDDFEKCLTDNQKKYLNAITQELIEEFDMLIIPLPGDEDKFGGCLASGRGFLHISSTGSLEACPFAPFSDTNVKNIPLKDAMKSRLLHDIRDKHHLLKESRGGCALHENKDWVESLIGK